MSLIDFNSSYMRIGTFQICQFDLLWECLLGRWPYNKAHLYLVH